MNMAKLLSKAVGAGAIILSVKDSHRVGVAQKNRAPKDYIARTYPDIYINSQRLDREALPTVVSGLKKSWFNVCMDDTTFPAIHGVTGYISGFSRQLVNNVLPLSLGLGALALKGKGGKICAGLLGLGALKIFLYDICNIGKYKKL